MFSGLQRSRTRPSHGPEAAAVLDPVHVRSDGKSADAPSYLADPVTPFLHLVWRSPDEGLLFVHRVLKEVSWLQGLFPIMPPSLVPELKQMASPCWSLLFSE